MTSERKTTLFATKRNQASMLITNVRIMGYEKEVKESHVWIDAKGELHILKENENLEKYSSETVIKGNGYTLMPGFLDAHVHGYGGPDFADANSENLPIITKALGDTGLSYCMATIVSLDLSKLKTSLAALDQYVADQNKNPTPGLTQIVGVHLEGPYIAKNCKGAHDEKVLQSKMDIEIFKEIVRAAPHISQWKITLAPELEGAIEFIRQTKNLKLDNRQLSIKVFIGHSNAEEKFIQAAVDVGAIGFTHLGNANQEEAHRCCMRIYQENKAEKKLDEKDLKSHVVRWVINHAKIKNCFIELITDGEHLSQAFVELIKNKVGIDKILLVTDSLGPSGCKEGEYDLGSLKILKQGSKFVLKDDTKKLAGSAASYNLVIKQFSSWMSHSIKDIPHMLYEVAVKNPRLSSLDPSFKLPEHKNFVLVDDSGNIILNFCNGRVMDLRTKHVCCYPER